MEPHSSTLYETMARRLSGESPEDGARRHELTGDEPALAQDLESYGFLFFNGTVNDADRADHIVAERFANLAKRLEAAGLMTPCED